MDNPSYAESWKKAAISAEAENMELIVFRLPKNSGAIKAVEDFLQEKFSESGTKIEE